MKIDRKSLLASLEAVTPGLAAKEIIEQSTSFAFRDGRVFAYNDEVLCSGPCPLHIGGVVEAGPLLALLCKLPDEEVDVEVADGELVMRGKKRRAGMTMAADILMPIEGVEDPDAWHDVPEDFVKAVEVARQCTSGDETQFALVCVHLCEKWIEGCDNYQLARWPMELDLPGSVLVRQSSLKSLKGMGRVKMCVTGSWLHFRNKDDVRLSCRRYEEEYPELEHVLDVKGERVCLPEGIGEVVERAEIFSGESVDISEVGVDLRPGGLRLRGTGPAGWYEEMKKIEYDGPRMSFKIRPDLLLEIAKRAKECTVSQERILVDGGGFTYVSCTGVSDDEET
jgi:hypothetical protein